MFDFLLRDAAQREGQWLELGGEKIWLAWKRHAKAKRLKLLVSADGPRLTLPMRASQKSALAFVAEHHAWILDQWRTHQPNALTPLVIGESTQVPLFGQDLPIIWQEDKALRVYKYAEHWRIHTSARSSVRQVQAALLHSYRLIGQEWFTERMQAYLPELPQAPSAMQIKPLRSLWGSLNTANAVSLDVALLFAPEDVAEYVLVHELCHLLQRNHSPKFWREVEARWPQWRVQRDHLKAHGHNLKAEARRLFG
jgi:predicted metal-dependent hydrolase